MILPPRAATRRRMETRPHSKAAGAACRPDRTCGGGGPSRARFFGRPFTRGEPDGPRSRFVTCCLWSPRCRGRRSPAAPCAPGYSPCSVWAAGSPSRGRTPARVRSRRSRARSRRTSDVGRSCRSSLSAFLRLAFRGGLFVVEVGYGERHQVQEVCGSLAPGGRLGLGGGADRYHLLDPLLEADAEPDGEPHGLVQVAGEVAVAVHLAALRRRPVDRLD